MRAKWSAPIRKYWKVSEQMMVKYCDLAICDSVNIEKYIHECYDGKGINGRNPKTTFIAYGADLTLSKLADDNEKLVNWYSLISTVVQSIFIVISIYVGKLADNVCISIILMVCVYCVIQVVYYTKLFDVMNKSMKPYIKKMVGCLVSIALIAIVVRFGCKAVIDRFDIEILNWFNVGLSFRN